ncbi:MAG: phage minor head protein [Pseudomonadota bacterium]
MSAEEQLRRFNAEAAARQRDLPRIQRDTLAEIVRQLQAAQRQITELLKANPSEAGQRRLRQLQREIERVLDDYATAVTQASVDGANTGWTAGITSIEAPFEAAGVSIAGARINAQALMATRSFMTDRIGDLSRRALNRINGVLIQNVIGSTPLSEAITQVQKIMGGVPRSRAMTVAYTEIGRVHSIAQDEALQNAGHIVPNLHKRWLKSGKLHPRAAHVAAHNQIRRYDEPYLVDGEHLRFPRDPNGSAGNTINCGCLSAPVVDGSSFGASTIRIGPQGGVHKVRLPT